MRVLMRYGFFAAQVALSLAGCGADPSTRGPIPAIAFNLKAVPGKLLVIVENRTATAFPVTSMLCSWATEPPVIATFDIPSVPPGASRTVDVTMSPRAWKSGVRVACQEVERTAAAVEPTVPQTAEVRSDFDIAVQADQLLITARNATSVIRAAGAATCVWWGPGPEPFAAAPVAIPSLEPGQSSTLSVAIPTEARAISGRVVCTRDRPS